jgi:putative intracellular protease/amidase
MKKFLRLVIYALAFVVPIIVLGVVGLFSTMRLTLPKPSDLAIPQTGTGSLSSKSFDPTKPTVAVVLGDSRTESTDFLIPYQLFSATDAYNVYAVAPERKTTSLEGGLEVMPDFSYAELDTLLGRSPDIVVIPAFPDVNSPENQPVLTWIKQQSDRGSYIFSICVGAEVFAATGRLDGRTATTHWGDITRIEAAYPAVNWVRGVRYVDGDSYMTSAGITSGMDAVLHYIAEHNGEATAQSVAQTMHYPGYAFVDNPRVEQYSVSPDLLAVGVLNVLFHWNHPTAGVLLYDGISELELASTYDTYAATYTTRLVSVSQRRQLITTQHGLQLVPRWGFPDVPAMERLIVPGSQARQLAAADVNAWQSNANTAPVFYLHADDPNGFAFDAPLRDLARQENIPTAVLDAMRLEYRQGTVQTEGSDWPVWLTIRPLLVGFASLAITLIINKHWHRRTLIAKGRLTTQTQA